MRFWENDGTGVYTETSADLGLTDARSGKGILKFDYDNDGDMDLYVTNNGDTPVLYRNDLANGNDWLNVVTSGDQSGAGAVVTVTPTNGATPLVREIHANSNFNTQDQAMAHFGLGEGSEPVFEVRIVWSDGIIQTSSSVARNSTVTFTHN